MPSTSICKNLRRLDSPIDKCHGYLEQRKKIGGHVSDQKQGYADIVLPRYKTVIFVHGCFWHGHPGCKYAYTPKSNTEFWINKISGNQKRDAATKRKLEESGWKVIIVWECEIRNGKDFIELIKRLCYSITHNI